jgi:hypothetical protein
VYYTVTLAKSKSDVYDYTGVMMLMDLPIDDGIRIVLQSQCDGEDVELMMYGLRPVLFRTALVIVSAPLNNWTYNKDCFLMQMVPQL